MRYIASVQSSGRIHTADFADAPQAWRWLRDERQKEEDAHPNSWDVYSDTFLYLDHISSTLHVHGDPNEDAPTSADGTGVLYGVHPAHLDPVQDACGNLAACPLNVYRVVLA